jgi:demethylmenaquinone methyltransferase/2-methoxy-6-polyprenyl-1,4-benzoquinol methylase
MSENTLDKPLQAMFTAVPPRYDLINKIITWGLDREWRNKAALTCLSSPTEKTLDLGCGTGDLAIAIKRLAKNDIEITGIDYSETMLEIARDKAATLTDGNKINFIHGDASDLKFSEGCFDCVGISFAFRNMVYRNPLSEKILSEVYRVLRSGGKFVIVESSQPRSRLIRCLYHLYIRGFVANVGGFLSCNKKAYKYLGESAALFYTPKEIKNMLQNIGFNQITYRPLFMGVAGIHVAVK